MSKSRQTTEYRNPRPPRFHQLPDPTFHNLQIALAIMAEDEGAGKVDTLVREACHDAASADDFFRIQRICDITKSTGYGSSIGPKIGAEILAALGRFLEDCENGEEPK